MTEKISRSIFKAYDIRGIVDKTLTEEACEQIGQALGTLAHEKKVEKICVGRDGRLSGPRLQKALIKGIRKAGVGVYDIGAVPTPVSLLYMTASLAATSTRLRTRALTKKWMLFPPILKRFFPM